MVREDWRWEKRGRRTGIQSTVKPSGTEKRSWRIGTRMEKYISDTVEEEDGGHRQTRQERGRQPPPE
jgi:hypothetical protein